MNIARISMALGLISVLGTTYGCRRIEESTGPVKGNRLALVYSGSLDGEIEPCG